MAEEIRPNLKQSTGDNVIGFPDLFKGSSGDTSSTEPLQLSAKGSSGGEGGGSSPTDSKVVSMFGELQAASELSVEELAKQTELLDQIEQNTKSMPTAGGQQAPSEADIKNQLDPEEGISEEQGEKIVDKLDSLSGPKSSLIAFAAAAAGANINLLKDMFSELSTGQKAGLAAVGTALAVGTAAIAKSVLGAPKKLLGGKDPKPTPKTKATKTTAPAKAEPKPKKTPPKAKANPKKSVAKTVAKGAAKQLGKGAAKVAAVAASGPAAPIVAGVLAAATVYELGTAALSAAGYDEEVEAFETGAMNAVGIETDEQELEKDNAKMALNKKKMDALVQKIDASDLSEEEKTSQKAQLSTALENSGDVDMFGDREARMADRTFAKFEKKYGATDLEAPTASAPESAAAIEAQTTEAKAAEAAAMAPQVNVAPAAAPNVNVPPSPAPNVSVTAVMPRTAMPSDPSAIGIQARSPKLIVT
jgi:cell division septation protein DedD